MTNQSLTCSNSSNQSSATHFNLSDSVQKTIIGFNIVITAGVQYEVIERYSDLQRAQKDNLIITLRRAIVANEGIPYTFKFDFIPFKPNWGYDGVITLKCALNYDEDMNFFLVIMLPQED